MTTILCVDDDASLVLLMEDTLQRSGYDTVGVHSVQAALTVLGRGGVNLIISDYRMPSGAVPRDRGVAVRRQRAMPVRSIGILVDDL